MAEQPVGPDPREVGKYLAFPQVGMEMVAPIAAGWAVDYYLETGPWGVAVGAILGLVSGLWHLIILAKKFEDKDAPGPRQKKQ
jgi:F0F1-type ATP synthase assembly protein I